MDKCTTKTCLKCSEPKPLDAFYVRRGKHQARCKACVLAQNKEYARRNQHAANEATRRWRERNPDKVRAANVAWYAANKDRNRERVREWREQNPEAWRALQADWRDREDRREIARLASAAWRAAHPGWPGSSREVRRLHEWKRRARKAAATVGEVDPEALWESQGGVCGLCDELIDRGLKYPDPKSPSLDHIIPLSKSGAHAQDNLQWAHLICNVRKGARMPTE